MLYEEENGTLYKRKLPHLQVKGAILFITWRLAFSLPSHVMETLKVLSNDKEEKSKNLSERYKKYLQANYERKKFSYYDEVIGRMKTNEIDLSKKPLGEIMLNVIKDYNNKMYRLIVCCVMPNHIHLMLIALPDTSGTIYQISEITKKLKQNSAIQINKAIGRSGGLWMAESYDRIIRSKKELERTVTYILNNPVKAGLVDKSEDWDCVLFDEEAYQQCAC